MAVLLRMDTTAFSDQLRCVRHWADMDVELY